VIQDSALNYIREEYPHLVSKIQYAQAQVNKLRMADAWQRVADQISEELNVPLGRLPVGSWTSVMAMPIRLAERVSSHISPRWLPPIPKPEYENPDKSGRILIATPDRNQLPAFARERRTAGDDSRNRPPSKFVSRR
jgi:hypothetical protein